MRKAIIVDIDGTIANLKHRLHYILRANKEKDYDAFYEGLEKDLPKRDVIELVNSLHRACCCIILMTCRKEKYRARTQDWLFSHDVSFDYLHMKSNNDNRSDEIVKFEIYEKKIKPEFDVLCVLEDRQKVVDMWRRNNLTCLQVEQWDEKHFSVQ